MSHEPKVLIFGILALHLWLGVSISSCVFSYSKTRTSLQKYNFSFIRYNFKGRKFYDSSFFC